jgi:hypothetical protein
VDRHQLHGILIGRLGRLQGLLRRLGRVEVCEEAAQRRLTLHRREVRDLVEEVRDVLTRRGGGS